MGTFRLSKLDSKQLWNWRLLPAEFAIGRLGTHANHHPKTNRADARATVEHGWSFWSLPGVPGGPLQDSLRLFYHTGLKPSLVARG